MAGKRDVPRYLREDPAWRELERKREAGIPRDAIEADLGQQAPNNSYSSKTYYQDYEFTCVDCGIPQVWTAEQNKWWYEVAKGPTFSVAVRRRACRNALRAAGGGNRRRPLTEGLKPMRTIGAFLKRVRELLDPILLAAGYSFSARSDPRCDQYLFNAWVDYCRGPKVISLALDSRGRTRSLTAMDEKAGEDEIVSLCSLEVSMTRCQATDSVLPGFSTAKWERSTPESNLTKVRQWDTCVRRGGAASMMNVLVEAS